MNSTAELDLTIESDSGPEVGPISTSTLVKAANIGLLLGQFYDIDSDPFLDRSRLGDRI